MLRSISNFHLLYYEKTGKRYKIVNKICLKGAKTQKIHKGVILTFVDLFIRAFYLYLFIILYERYEVPIPIIIPARRSSG